MREFLSARRIPFVERNIRRDQQAKADLLALTGKLTVPVVVVGDRQIVGYDPELLASLGRASDEEETVTRPPGDSAALEQGPAAAPFQDDMATTLRDLILRLREELAYNASKGSGPYRQGMHDGLRFAEDALLAIVTQAGVQMDLTPAASQTRKLDA